MKHQKYHQEEGVRSYCLGDGECDIPDTETAGPISLNYDEETVSELSYRAITDNRYEFAFVATGDDNEESDCMHDEFSFSIEIPYLSGE